MMSGLALVMIAAALGSAAWVVQVSGKRLIVSLIVLAFGVGSINPLIEAVVFGVMPIADVFHTMTWQLILAAMISVTVIGALGKWRDNSQVLVRPALTPVRLVAATVCYAVLYLAAGMVVFPFVKDFYATKTLPPLSIILSLQLIRGLLYVLYAWLWFRLAPRHAGLVLGLVYAVLGGIAPLLADNNPYMPQDVRFSHMWEVRVSKFLFGLIVGRLIGSVRTSIV
jgi:hypothetical protein